ncbi:calpain-like protease palB/RIM13 [Dioszegia hungarica]|uniref:Calpain-like protease palB/RIM13 n=1 Tax=Dioszegia hungarica TaxID=4972 RepID=A0AA38H1M8_9TREE|nr:calpain-like protease palB/RIM13 [Dioszegia hungarica]KAI9632395.1 calpain-like protease palB/RIM13 [Dioszegia hungarica]
MAFNTYAQGLKIASDLAQRAVLVEASLPSLPPLASPIPVLQKAFPLYISAAETYSHLLASSLVPDPDKAGIKRKWRLVLERAEKVKNRIEELGGQVGKVGIGDEGEEEAVRRRGGRMNGVDLDRWSLPSNGEFELGRGVYRAESQPDLAVERDTVVWREVDEKAWTVVVGEEERWMVNQGAGADCSVVAGLGVCLEHNRRWGTKLAMDSLYPQSGAYQPRQSENGKHILKLLLNGEWRGVIIDSLLPRSATSHLPLHATSQRLSTAHETGGTPSIGPPWIPLALKAYFLAHGGYSLRGSNPAPDIYAFTGWIPERISLREGFQREKEWKRVYSAWTRGEVLVTLGTGKEAERGLIPLHAYAVLDVKEEAGERMLEIFDPGLPPPMASTDLAASLEGLTVDNTADLSRTGLFSMTWDEACSEFGALNLNWNPSLRPISAKRHWSWPKPDYAASSSSMSASHPRYRLSVASAPAGTEVWILLSQHIVSKDRALDDIALHVHEERAARPAFGAMQNMASPYSNAQHVLYRHTIRSAGPTTLLVVPSRDRGVSRSNFTLQAFSPPGSTLSLERISTTLPFSQSVSGALTSRSAGGHAGWPSYGSNPQYKVTIGNSAASGSKRRGNVRLQVGGEGEGPWNIKLLWSNGGLVHDVSEEAVVADSGPYAYGMAFGEASGVAAGTYTVIVSSFEPGITGHYTLTLESTLPITITPIPPEGAGLYHRRFEGRWTENNTGGRPSLNAYHLNPHLDLLLPAPLTLQCRLHHPGLGQSIPLNLTLFARAEGGGIGKQIATSGAYSDQTSGVRIARTRPGVLQAGVYVLVPSGYGRGEGKGKAWRVDVWADGPFSLDMGK